MYLLSLAAVLIRSLKSAELQSSLQINVAPNQVLMEKTAAPINQALINLIMMAYLMRKLVVTLRYPYFSFQPKHPFIQLLTTK